MIGLAGLFLLLLVLKLGGLAEGPLTYIHSADLLGLTELSGYDVGMDIIASHVDLKVAWIQ